MTTVKLKDLKPGEHYTLHGITYTMLDPETPVQRITRRLGDLAYGKPFKFGLDDSGVYARVHANSVYVVDKTPLGVGLVVGIYTGCIGHQSLDTQVYPQ